MGNTESATESSNAAVSSTDRDAPASAASISPAGSRVEVAAMDLTKDDKLVFACGDQLSFLSRGSDVKQGWTFTHSPDKKTFTPRKLMLDDASRRTVALSDRRSGLSIFDTETGTPVRESRLANRDADIPMDLDSLVCQQKFDQFNPKTNKVLTHVAVSKNMLFNVVTDLRENKDVFIVEDRAEIKTAHVRFSCVATTGDGHVAVGSNNGEVRLFEKPDVGPWKRAKTVLDELSGIAPVTAIDVTRDGAWIVWTTDRFLVLVNVELSEHQGGRHLTGFEKPIPSSERPVLMCLRLDDATCNENGLVKDGKANYQFREARFDNAVDAGIIEETVTCVTDQFVCVWKMRSLKLDYKKCQSRMDSTVQPRLVKDPQNTTKPIQLYQPEFQHKNSVVIATADDLARLTLGD